MPELCAAESTPEELLHSVLPAGVIGAAAVQDPAGIPLFFQEEMAIARAVGKRKAEFATARLCARRALARLGVAPAPLIPGERGAPCWPSGIVGSLTHCAGYRAAAVAPVALLDAIGIDAEPHLPLPSGVLDMIALPEEASRVRTLLRTRPEIYWDRLLFSAKEAVYKAWYPLVRRRLDFDEVVVELGHDGVVEARVECSQASPGQAAFAPWHVRGAWAVGRGLIVTAATIPASRY